MDTNPCHGANGKAPQPRIGLRFFYVDESVWNLRVDHYSAKLDVAKGKECVTKCSVTEQRGEAAMPRVIVSVIIQV